MKNTVKSYDLKPGSHSSHAGSSVLNKALYRSYEEGGILPIDGANSQVPVQENMRPSANIFVRLW